MTTTSTRVLFAREPRGLPSADNFSIESRALPALESGQFLVRNLYLSLDPYMRMLMGGGWQFRGGSMTPGQIMIGRTLGVVEESRHADFAAGDHVVGSLGWQTHAVSDGKNLDFRVTPKEGVPLTAYLGACGSNGVTAWAGIKKIAAPREGETVLVSAAAGSVGSAAGQIAKAMGCRAVGIAGGGKKCAIVTDEFGFDACCDYKGGELAAQITKAAPQGVDVYFDNVGGEMLDTIMPLL
ncbi:MAG: NADP-dependent oxidoreductase, partial [Gammaproteobacteria bacterium]|nr:NADP-dependent oxidoreductase [Gammaproteobacteria bacterium]